MTGKILINIFFGAAPLFFVYLVIIGAFMFILKKTKRL